MVSTLEISQLRSRLIIGRKSRSTLVKHLVQVQSKSKLCSVGTELSCVLCRATPNKLKAKPAPRGEVSWAGPDVEVEPDSDEEDVETVPSILLSDVGENTARSMLQYFSQYDPLSAVVRDQQRQSNEKVLVLQFSSSKMRDVVTTSHMIDLILMFNKQYSISRCEMRAYPSQILLDDCLW